MSNNTPIDEDEDIEEEFDTGNPVGIITEEYGELHTQLVLAHRGIKEPFRMWLRETMMDEQHPLQAAAQRLLELEHQDDPTDLAEIMGRDIGSEPDTLAANELTVTKKKKVALSETAIVTDSWGRKKGRELKKQAEFAASTLSPNNLSDCFNAAFEMYPMLAEECEEPHVQAFFKELMESPDFEKVREATALDVGYSEMAAVSYAMGLQAVCEAQQQAQQQQQNGTKPGEKKVDPNKVAQRMAAKCARQANQQVQQQQDMCESLGIGNEDGGGGKLSKKDIKAVHAKIKNSQTLRRICELAGRYRRAAQSAQRNKTRHGIDEVVGIELSGEVSRLLPHELAMLDDEDFGDDTLRRLSENQCLSREVRASEKIAKGPIVVAVDESGSMEGDKIYNAKAFALAMAQIASTQKRWCVLMAWASKNERRSIVMKPGQWPVKDLVKWLEDMIDGGTHPPTLEMPQWLEQWKAPKGKTDMILITDGECNEYTPTEQDKFNAWKQEEKFRMITMLVGLNESKALKPISDQIFSMSKIEAENEAVTAAFSV